jgi:glycosyltransferase involved in cell wall biosynthesis
MVKTGGYDVAFSIVTRAVRLDGCPVVTMIRNIEPIQRPVYQMPLLWRLRLWMLRYENAKAIRQASRVLAISSYVKEEVCRRFKVNQEKVDVVYHGFDPVELGSARKPDFTIPEEFMFSAGSIVPYRGYEDIIRSLAILRAKGATAPCAVLAGSGGYHPTAYERSLKKLAQSLGVENSILWAGQLSRDEMAWCFQNAKFYIQTSRAEACPNIVLEAMGHGCASISCDHPPMPEFFADTALFYPVGAAGHLADTIDQVLQMNPEQIMQMQYRARQRASCFTWEKTADETLAVLERAVRNKP